MDIFFKKKKCLAGFILFFFSWVCVFTFSACVIDTHSITLKKSAETRPSWVSHPEQLNREKDKQESELVLVRKHVYNLALGIKQFENIIATKMKPLAVDYLIKDIYWEYDQKQLPGYVENEYVIWVCISVPKSEYQRTFNAFAPWVWSDATVKER